MSISVSRALTLITLLGGGCATAACSSASSNAGRDAPGDGVDVDGGTDDSTATNDDDDGDDDASSTDESDDAGVGSGGGDDPDEADDADSDDDPDGFDDALADDTSTTDDEVSDDDTVLPPSDDCVEGIPATSQIPRLLNREYDAIIRDLLGVTTLAGAGGAAPSALLAPDSTGEMTPAAWDGYLTAAEMIANEVITGPNATRFIECDPDQQACLESTIETFGRKALRRPLNDEDVARYLALTETDPPGTPEQVAETILFGFLASPSFLTVPELNETASADGTFALSSHEVATRLSLLIWGSIPDDDLNAAADAGELQSADQILAQAMRMLEQREKVAPQLIAAHHAYAGIRTGSHWGEIDHDSAAYPHFSSAEAVNSAAMAEMDAYFEKTSYEGTFDDLFTSNVAFVNQATAPIYGLDAAAFGESLSETELDPSERPGFLTRVGFLASFSHYDSTAPMLRGAYIATTVVGVNPGPPIIDSSPPTPPGDYQTNREASEALVSDAACTGCHQIINPPGFVLEVYDAVGAVQETDPLGGPIDPTADVMVRPGVTKTIETPEELMMELAKSPEARRLYAEKIVSYATRRSPNGYDACIVDDLTARLMDDTYPLRRAFGDISTAESFRFRVAAE